MKDYLLNTYAMTHGLARNLVADVPCERFAEEPFAGAKHPAWVLGHLTLAGAMGVAYLKDPTNPTPAMEGLPQEWMPLFMGPPLADRGAYPTKDEILGAFDQAHAGFSTAVQHGPEEVFNMIFPNEQWRSFFPTLGSAGFYLMAHHEGYHLGQLSQWRRAAGFQAAPDPS